MLRKQLLDAYSEITGGYIEATDNLEIAKELVKETRAQVKYDFLTILKRAFEKAPNYNDEQEDEKTRDEIIEGFKIIFSYFDPEAVKVTENFVIFDNIMDDIPLEKLDILAVESMMVDHLVHRNY